MKERPILFSGEMVRSILEGRKTQTRRVMRHQAGAELAFQNCPYGQPGDRLWVREMFATLDCHHGQTVYRADGEKNLADMTWKPSIHMPRRAARLTLEIVRVRGEKLNDISEEDAEAEGARRGIWCNDGVLCDPMDEDDEKRASFRHGYGFLWETINGPGSWDKNPWVWVVEFRRLQ